MEHHRCQRIPSGPVHHTECPSFGAPTQSRKSKSTHVVGHVVGGVGVVVGDVGDGVDCVGSLVVGVDGEGLVGSDGSVGSVVGVVGFDVVG